MSIETANAAIPEKKLLKTPENHENNQLKPAVLTTPFKKIAMAFSGGGFRASAFSLGAMSYLHTLPYPDDTKEDKTVLDNVEFIASTSGGTFAGILYSMHVRKKVPFKDTYRQLIDFMNGQVLLENVLSLINNDQEWQGDKSRNFINAFSKLYDEKLFDHATFGVYWPEENEHDVRPMEVCFNATEFYRGLSFRFQASTNPHATGNTGNKYVFFNKGTAESEGTLKMIRLGDILAASSCFPAGFEPILFPTDFTYASGNEKTLGKPELQKAFITTDFDNNQLNASRDIGFMDGGIDDNQGVYSTMLADSRRRNHKPDNGFDLIFVTDVASYFMDAYEAPVVSTNGDYRKETIVGLLNKPVGQLFPRKNKLATWVLIGSAIMLLLSIGLLTWAPRSTYHDGALVLLTISVIILLGIWALKKIIPVKTFLPEAFSLPEEKMISLLKTSLPAIKNFSDKAIGQLLKYLSNAPLGVVEQIFKTRLNSTLSMVLDINLKQTRRLIFDTLYGRFYGEDIWQNRRVFNVIYELSSMNKKSRMDILKNKFHEPDPWADDCLTVLTAGCDELNKVAESARTMATTLWFDEADVKKNRMKEVVACGQFTTCAKLLEYAFIIERILQKQEQDTTFEKQVVFDAEQSKIFRQIKQQLERDWSEFKEDPFYLTKKYPANWKD